MTKGPLVNSRRVTLHEVSGSRDFVVECTVTRLPDGLELAFEVRGDLGVLYPGGLPPMRVRAGRDLWKRTCLETFFFAAGSTRYVELNWNVLGEHALLGFAAYRRPADVPLGFEVLAVERSVGPSRLASRLTLGLPAGCRYLLSPTAVLCPTGAAPLHFAFAHAGRPDFHAREVVEAAGTLFELC